MSITFTLEEEQAMLIATVTLSDVVGIPQDAEPVAELPRIATAQPRPQFGSCRGMLTVVREDKEHVADFTECMS